MADDDKRERDLDETRRLLYMASVASRTERYNLVGTVVNALVHHHAHAGISAEEATEHLLRVVRDGSEGSAAESRDWLDRQISRITSELSENSGLPS